MHNMILIAALIMGLVVPSMAATVAATERPPLPVLVTEVKDGDTFEIAFEGGTGMLPLTFAVRVRGINAAEVHSNCGASDAAIAALPVDQRRAAREERIRLRRAERTIGHAAAEVAKGLIRESGNRVTLLDYDHDKYGGRIDARVILADGRDFAEEMIRLGQADRYDGGTRLSWCGR